MKKTIISILISISVISSAFPNSYQDLKIAVWSNDTNAVKLLLETGGVDLNQDSYIFMEAIKEGHIEIVKLFLKNGADPNAENFMALIEATRRNHIEIVRLLLEGGANPNARSSLALVEAICRKHTEIVKLFFESNVKLHFQDSEDVIGSVVPCSRGDTEIIKLLIKNGANSNAQDSQALIDAAETGYIEIVKLLLENGANASAQDSKALIDTVTAGIHNSTEIVKLLIEHGANPSDQDSKALIDAIKTNHKEIVKLLVDHGADPIKALKYIIRHKIAIQDYDIFTLLIAHCTDDSQLLNHTLVQSFINLVGFDTFKSVYESKQILFHPTVIKEVLLSANYEAVRYFFENIPELKDAYLIGVGLNTLDRGSTTDLVLNILSNKIKSHKNSYHVEISLEIAQDENIMQHFSGFINPGGGDSFPKHNEPFGLADMNEEKKEYHEKVYQTIITMAKEHDIPYLGICAGAQHLILNNGGSLKKNDYLGTGAKITFSAGTIPHFLLLTEREKAKALSGCKFEDIELINAYSLHGYSGYTENLGEYIKLGAISEEGLPEAYSLGANKIGVQFHPEKKYYNDDDSGKINRDQQFLNNVFGIFEGYYRSMQYAKKTGISKEVAKAAIQKVNEELIERLEYCGAQITYESGSINSILNFIYQTINPKAPIHLWDKGLNIEYKDSRGTISIMPGLTVEDISITRGSNNNLIIRVKDGDGQLTILDDLNVSNLGYPLRLAFADGSIINLNDVGQETDISYSGENLI